MKQRVVVCLTGLLLSGLVKPAWADLTLQPVATGLDHVTVIANAGDGSGRLFIALQAGLIVIRDGTGVRPTPFLDIRSLVSYGAETGLLGLAFPGNFASSSWFYVHYVDKQGRVIIARYHASGPDPNVAIPGGEIVLTVPQPSGYANHKGGQLAFGPDGYLYIGLGDGGGGGDPSNNGQNLHTLLGKILRIDVSDGGSSYAVPSNPVGGGALPEIWAYGLRNPWRFSFDRTTGDMIIGDVGQENREEIDFQPAGVGGQNYGWRRTEGTICYDPVVGCDTTGLTPPIMEYAHMEFGQDIGCSVTGGYRYRGSSVPGLGGAYLFADYCTGLVWAARPDAGGKWAFAPAIETSHLISTFGEDQAGEIYVADARTSGGVYKIVTGTPALSVSDAHLVEGNSGTQDALFTVHLLPASLSAVTVAYATIDGRAKAGDDYTSTTGSVTFPAGATRATIAVPVLGDSAYEQDEDFSLALSSPVNASILAYGGTGRAAIENDDSGLSIADVAVGEGNSGTTDATFTVTRAGVLSSALSVDYTAIDGTALAGVDYVATTGTLLFAAGQATGTLVVPVIGDLLVEPTDAFTVSLSNAVGGSIVRGTATATIYNDDTGPGITVDDVAVPEGDAGTKEAVFTVSLSYPSAQMVTVFVGTSSSGASGTGAPVPDYEDERLTLSFAPGQTTQSVPVTVFGDALNEDDETFIVYFGDVTNGHVVRQGKGTILDDDPLPSVSIGSVVQSEGDAGQKSASFPLTLSAPSGRVVMLPYSTSPGTASEGVAPTIVWSETSYVLGSGKAGRYPWTIDVSSFSGSLRNVKVKLSSSCLVGPYQAPLLGALDVLLVGPQGQSVVLMSDVGGAFGAGDSGVLTFDDDGPALPLGTIVSGTYRPTDYVEPGQPDAFASPAPAGPFGATLSPFRAVSPLGTWSLYVVGDHPALSTGCAAAWGLELESDDDYVRTVGTVNIAPGTTTVAIDVPVVGDSTLEPDETFNLDLGASSQAVIAVGHGLGTIVNDDLLRLRVGDLDMAEGDHDLSTAVFVVSLDQPGIDTVTVDFATVDGTASAADGDYLPASGTLTFPPGATAATVAVSIVGDTWHEEDESFSLVLSTPSNASLARATGVVTLPNDDPLPALSVADVVGFEGGLLSFAVVLSAPSREPVSVAYGTSDGTARSGLDYVAAGGTLVFPAESQSQIVSVSALTDAKTEPSESLRLALSAPAHAEIARGTATGWILDPKTVPRVQFSSAAYTVKEAGRRAVVTVRRTGDARQAVSVSYAATDGTAHAGGGYTAVSGVLTFGPGVAAKAFAVSILDDSVVDGSSTVLLSLGEVEGPALLGTPDTAVLTIVDDDVAGSIRFGKAQYSVNEAGGAATISVIRSGGTAGDVRVDYAAADDTATGGVDYHPTSGTLTFGPRTTVQAFTVPVLVDDQAEGSERVTLGLSNPTGGASLSAPAEATLTVTDAQPTVEFASGIVTARESVARVLVTVVRSGPITGTATVRYATSDGTALQGIDYAQTSGTLTFGPGKAFQTFLVTLLNDRLPQDASTILLSLSDPQGAVLGAQASAVLSIQDDDKAGVVQFSAPSYRAADRAPAAVFTVVRSGGAAEGVVVDYSTADGTALAGTHYVATSGHLEFGAGVARQSVLVPLLDAGTPQGDETVLLSLANPGGGASLGARSSAILTITSTDPIVQFTAPAYRALALATSATVSVARSGPLDGTVTVDYTASNGTALAGEDYAPTFGTLTFQPGVRLQTFTVHISTNDAVEGDETVNLALSGPTGGAALGGRSAAVLTLASDDPVVQWAKPEVRVSERSASVALAVKRLGPTGSPATLHFATSDLSAESGADYSETTGTVTFAPGVVSQVVRVPIANDTPDEAPESFQVTLSAPGAGTLLGTPSVVTVTIDDDDVAGTVQLAAVDYSAKEEEGLANVTVVRTGGSAGGVTVDFATSDGTAHAGTNYDATTGTLVFGPGETSKTFSVPIHSDGAAAGNLSLGLILANPGGGATLGVRAAGRLWIVGS